MTNFTGFFTWADEMLVPTLYEEGYGNDMQSALLGGVRLRQARVKRGKYTMVDRRLL